MTLRKTLLLSPKTIDSLFFFGLEEEVSETWHGSITLEIERQSKRPKTIWDVLLTHPKALASFFSFLFYLTSTVK
jgi:hypothetical protein